MIIRRRHTANFTTIGNALFKDERLAADEVGVIATLLSMPHDWEVRRPALARRWKVGRDSIKRIIHSAMRTGWIVASKTRLSNGTFHIVYEVRDEPGPELSPEEIKAALSLVSSGAGQDESGDDDGQDSAEPDADPGGTPPTENPSWSAGQPGLAQPPPANPSRPIEDSLKPESLRNDSNQIGRNFRDVLSRWPPEHVLSRVVCERLHAALTDADQEAAVEYAGPYVSDRAAQGAKLCDLKTYYEGRRWERLAQKTVGPVTQFHVRPHTPQAYRWRKYLERAEPQKLRMFDLMMARNGYTAPSEWPPPLPPKSPETLSPADINEFTKS